MNFTFNEYQSESFKTAKYPEFGTGSLLAVMYCGLGLGEGGEAQGKIKKILRDYNGQITPEMKKAIIAEVSDLLWYVSALATELGVPLEEVAYTNIKKLTEREIRGTICGSGDDR